MKTKTKKTSSALDTLDLMRDEFIRIMCLPCTDEVNGICERALKGITMKTPILQEVAQLRDEVIRLRNDAARMDYVEERKIEVVTEYYHGRPKAKTLLTREWIDNQLL